MICTKNTPAKSGRSSAGGDEAACAFAASAIAPHCGRVVQKLALAMSSYAPESSAPRTSTLNAASTAGGVESANATA